jgi:hypothetical protein
MFPFAWYFLTAVGHTREMIRDYARCCAYEHIAWWWRLTVEHEPLSGRFHELLEEPVQRLGHPAVLVPAFSDHIERSQFSYWDQTQAHNEVRP